MDKDVYTDKTVGDFFNVKFISLKLQMDRSDKDNECIKRSYSDADLIAKEYTVTSYPSYLFFFAIRYPSSQGNGLSQDRRLYCVG